MDTRPAGEGAEEAVRCFMRAWASADFNRMGRWVTKTWDKEYGEDGSLPNLFSVYSIASWDVGAPLEISDYMVDVPVTLTTSEGSEVQLVARAIIESGPYRPSKNGTWGVNPFSVLRQEVTPIAV